MSLLSRFDQDLKSALKASEKLKVSVLRLVKAAVKNKQIEKGAELSEEEIISVLSSMVKQRRESIEQFSAAGRLDLAEREDQEIALLREYMPQQLSRDAVETLIHDAIREVSAQGNPDVGRVMRVLMPKIKGVADGKYINQRVQELLATRA